MTETPPMERLLLMPEEAAVRAHFDARNCRVLFRLLLAFVLAAMVIALVTAIRQRYAELAVPLVNLVLVRLVYMVRERPVFSRHFRSFLLGLLVAQALLWRAVFFEPSWAFHPADFLAPLLLLFFRLPPAQLAVPLGVVWGASVGRNLVEAAVSTASLDYGGIVGQTAVSLVVFSLTTNVSRRQRLDFLVTWRREAHRARERRRMQEEIGDARKIQLSMLPKSEPKLDWLEVAGISIPASEVGGDYYDYFNFSPARQAVVVGDVAGHGLASGLLLSGVRSCLHLLQETPLEPVEVLGKIDRMLRQTAVSRNFVTLLYAVFDQAESTLTFASAGHPPILHRHRGGEVEELTAPALPLGVQLGSEPRQRSVGFQSGDLFLFTTDGLAETLNSRGDVYGDDRLLSRLHRVQPSKSAREIRDLVLSDLWTFKEDGQQIDDITLVIAKVR